MSESMNEASPAAMNMKEIYPIDGQGFVQFDSEKYRYEASDYECLENEIDKPIPRDVMFYQPRWDGEQWVEGGAPPESMPETAAIPSLEQRVAALEMAKLADMLGGATHVL